MSKPSNTSNGGNGSDSRSSNARRDTAMAEIVERGVAFHHALGLTVATAYLRENAVPAEVVRRVFGNVQARRPACPEQGSWR